MATAVVILAIVLFFLVLFLLSAIKVAREYERGIVFRLGRLLPEPKGPGLFVLIPIVDRIVQVENFMVATSQIAQTTLRSVLGQHQLDELLSEREKINTILQEIIDEQTAPWGIKVSIVEVKDVEIPQGMQHAMARQAEAERERRAKGINAEGEFQAAARLAEAADVISRNPATLQLRYLQTLSEVGVGQNSTIVFPMPMDLITPLLDAASRSGQTQSAQTRPP